MNKKLVGIIVLVSALSLSACGGKKAETASTTTDNSTAAATAAATGGFDSALDLGGGVSLTVSAPKSFVPGQFASNYVKGQAANSFDVTVKNGGTTELDPSTILIETASGANTCTDVLDGDNGIAGAPTDSIAAGAQISFKFAVACDAKAGDALHVNVAVGSGSASIDGKVA